MGESNQTADEFFAAAERAAPAHPNDALVPPGQRPCPICRAAMRVESSFGVAIDVCADHGAWLDRGELEQIVHAAQAVPQSVLRAAVERARRDGKLQGVVWGWMSLFTDFKPWWKFW